MPVIPSFYIDNVTVRRSSTINIRGNTVSDIFGPNDVQAYDISNVNTLRMKDNKAFRIRSSSGQGTGFNILLVTNVVAVYSVASRTDVGFNFSAIRSLDVYNLTAHLCARCVATDSAGTFRNIALSAYKGYDQFNKSTGFLVTANTIDVDYCYYHGLFKLVESGLVTLGTTVSEQHLLYIDEANDEYTSDYISPSVNSGTPNPLRIDNSDISGIESTITTEETANRKYFYSLIDNHFWDVDSAYSGESCLIKAFNSRNLANTEAEIYQVNRDTRIKTSYSIEKFAELYPAYQRYASRTKYQKRVADLWFSGQNPAVVQSYQNSIGGYNLFPSFFKHMSEYEDGWIISESDVEYDNWLNSMLDLKYGIGIDVLGVSTMNKATSGECYINTMSSIADIAPVRWFLHNEVQPTGYVVFTDMWNNFGECTLDNMVFNDDFNISIDEIDVDGECLTPLISTTTITSSSVEVSLLDRVWSEDINRYFYFRQGADIGTMSAWEEITDWIGGVLTVDQPYIQFKINVENVHRQIDYEFQGISLRPYTSDKDWTKPQPAPLFVGGSSIYCYDLNSKNQFITVEPSPELPMHEEITKIFTISSTLAYAVGYKYDDSGDAWSVVKLWNGQTWTSIAALSDKLNCYFFSVDALDKDNVWISGGDYDNFDMLLYRWDGLTWTKVNFGALPKLSATLFDISVVSPTSIWGVCQNSFGDDPLAMHYDGVSWVWVDISAGILALSWCLFTNVSGLSDSDMHFSCYDDEFGTLKTATFDGTEIVPEYVTVASDYNGFNFINEYSDGTIWAGGGLTNRVIHYTGTVWETHLIPFVAPIGTAIYIYGLYPVSSSEMYLIATYDTQICNQRYFAKYDGTIVTILDEKIADLNEYRYYNCISRFLTTKPVNSVPYIHPVLPPV